MTEVLPGCAYLATPVPAHVADAWLVALRALPTWRQEQHKLYGKVIPFPRLVAWHGDPGCTYRYSSHTNYPEPWTDTLEDVRATVAPNANGVLLNWYRNGQDSIGAHSDDEDDMVPGAPIVCVSLGTARTLVFRHKRVKTRALVPLRHGSVLVMHGICQYDWRHEIPKEPEVTDDRISLTFRTVVPQGART